MKSEPDCYSIDRLEKEKTGHWDGVRNYQARNFMRDDMKLGDMILFYHSSVNPAGIVGLATVCKESYPDHTAWDPRSDHFDPKSTPEKPIWMMVDVAFVKRFSEMVSLHQLKTYPELQEMLVLRKGQRLSVQPVEKAHFDFICQLAA